MSAPVEYRVVRDVTPQECWWLSQTVAEGATVYKFTKPTYGVVTPEGQAVTLDPQGDYPFFELPRDAIEEAEEMTQL